MVEKTTGIETLHVTNTIHLNGRKNPLHLAHPLFRSTCCNSSLVLTDLEAPIPLD